MSPLLGAFLVLAGVGTGVYGTLVGLGGGFVLIPLLLFLYPQETPRDITSTSLAVVFFNGLSGTVAYAWMRRIDFRTGLPFALATIPGAVLGALAIAHLSRFIFELIFGSFLTLAALGMLFRPGTRLALPLPGGNHTTRTLVDSQGTSYTYSFNMTLGIAISFLVGFVASLLGLAGGIIHVPVLIALLGFPPHLATATSQFILTITAFSGSLTHTLGGVLNPYWGRIALLSLGVVVGAQVGARLSTRVSSTLLVRLLAVALLLVGLRLALGAWIPGL